MKKISIDELNDFWEDFSSSVITKEVNLSDALIFQVKKINSKNAKTVVDLLCTSVRSLSQEVVHAEVKSHKILQLIKYSGCFYKVGGCYYIPNENVKRRCIYDYFSKVSKNASDINVNSFAPDINSVNLASAFKRNNRIVFLGTALSKNYVLLTGMKSKASNKRNTIDGLKIAKALDVSEFWTEYHEKKANDFTFKFYCKVNDVETSKDGTPLLVCICDNIMGRKSIRVDIVAELNGRMYILNHVDVEHRTLKSSNEIASTIIDMLKSASMKCVKKDISAEEIKKASLKYVPKRYQKEFEFALDNANEPIVAAYDIIGSGIFSVKDKGRKTVDYDAGQRKYELALGSAMLIN